MLAVSLTGSAQLSCVEFHRMGQRNFVDSDDPRFSLAFHTLGGEVPSYVKRCSFNHNYNSFLGVIDSANVTVEDNVAYHMIGNG